MSRQRVVRPVSGAVRAWRARALGGVLAGCLALVGCSASPEQEAPPTPRPTPERTAPPPPAPEPEPEPEPALGSAAVSAGHPAAVDAGMQMLERGGTAVDAAVAAAFAVSVVEPFASGIGGGGSAIVVEPGGEPVGYDFREVVPAGGAVPAGRSGVPGLVAGLARLHEEHGTLEWSDLLAPAVALAREGHPVSEMLGVQLRTRAGAAAAGGLDHLYPQGRPLAPGELLVQDDLAATLDRLAQGGAAELYAGPLGAAVTAAVPEIDAASLANYGVQVSDPPRGRLGDVEVVSAAPALPGAALIQMLQIAEALGIGAVEPGSGEYVHLLSAAWARAAQTVESELGDPDFVHVPVAEITDPGRNAQVAAEIAGGTSLSSSAGPPESSETTHLTVVDAEGRMISMTNTLTYFWGSGQYVDGYFLNNQMVRFSVGAGGSNAPEPGRRSVSWGMPTVVLDEEGRPVLGLGSPGGERIPMVLGNVIVRWALHDEPLTDVVAAPRFAASGSEIEMERLPAEPVLADLRARGYAVTGPVPDTLYAFGSVQALEVDWDAGTVVGAVDTRREADLAVREEVAGGAPTS